MFLSHTNRATALPTSIVLPTYLRYFSLTLIHCFPQSRNDHSETLILVPVSPFDTKLCSHFSLPYVCHWTATTTRCSI